MAVYSTLARLDVRHGYYRDKICRDLGFRPTPATAATLRRFGVLMRPSQGGFQLAFQPARLRDLHTDGAPSFLGFAFDSHNPEFVSFTELPGTIPQQIVYLGGTGPILSLEAVDLRPMSFEQPIGPIERSGRLVVRNALGRSVWSEELRRVQTVGVDLGQEPPGRYTLLLADEPVAEIYADNSLYRRPPLGVVDLNFERLLRSDSTPMVFDASFNARATLWRYNLIGLTQEKARQLRVVDSAGEFKFQLRRGARSFSSGQVAQVFESDAQSAIQLREVPEYSFSLVRQSHTLIPRLPFPSKSITGTTESGRFYSDIYVIDSARTAKVGG